MHTKKLSVHKDMPRTREWLAKRPLIGCKENMMRWPWNDGITIDNWRNFVLRRMRPKSRYVNFSVGCALRVMNPCQMAEYLKKSEAELNELLAEYWKLRHETGMTGPINVFRLAFDKFSLRCVYGNPCEQTQYASFCKLGRFIESL
jgi:hypothetical protein